jgi:uncharacterized protein DUF541
MKQLFVLLFAAIALASFSARADDYPNAHRPDDRVMFDVSAEDWVTTKTAHVSVQVEAAVSAGSAGTTRADMMKAVNGLAKADWRITSFDRNQDQTGLERWSATFEARLPESDLSGLGENAKKLSKAGLQLTIADIDFSPTLEEMETTRASLRAQIYKIANDQLATLNASLPGRGYRIALVNFTGDENEPGPMPRVTRGRPGVMMATAMAVPAPAAPPEVPMERSQKVTLSARIVYAAMPEGKLSAPAPIEQKH